MPEQAASAMLQSDGRLVPARGRTLPRWAADEIVRIAGVLEREHQDFLRRAVDALGGQLPVGFDRPDASFPIRDDGGLIAVTTDYPRPEVDLRNSDDYGKKPDRWQAVRSDYRRDRFMRDLPEEQLARRIADIVSNSTGVNEAGLITPAPLDDVLGYWFDRLTEATEELAIRFGPFPAGLDRPAMRLSGLPGSLDVRNLRRPAQLASSRRIAGSVLVKYGKLKYLRTTLTEGRIRIAPASTYADASLNVAIQADELSEQIQFEAPVEGTPPPSLLNPPTHVRVLTTLRFPTNYYVYCLSRTLSLRLLYDFEADACLIVHDPKEFSRRLLAGVREHTQWTPSSGSVNYFDPLQVQPGQVRLPIAKHFRYAYQQEHRFVWLPPSRMEALDPLFVELGSLEDIAEIVVPTKPKPQS
jgi:hypothetical protein